MSPAVANQTLHLCGLDLLAEASGALLWPEESTLIVADLHLEKGSSFATRGVMLPPYDTAATLDRLERVVASHAPQRVICLGDSFHDATAPARLGSEDGRRLAQLTTAAEWCWLAGNHDPAPPAALGGRVITDALRLGPLTFRHIADGASVEGEISGHFHPKASLTLRGRRLSGRCFVSDERRLIMPAFGAYAGGLDVCDPALRTLFPDGFTVHLLARERITVLPRAKLAGMA